MRSLIFVLSLGFSLLANAQLGDRFPELTGETLESLQISIPSDTDDKITLVGLAYSKKAEETLKTWYTPIYDKFVLKRGIFDEFYDVNLFFVPMFSGAKKATYESTLKKLKQSNRKDLFPYILFYKGSMKPYVDNLEMDNKALPYFFVLDEAGTILYATKGLYSERKMEAIEEILDSRME
ncbi:MAG: hypothetical protein HKN32_00180 [Flavobacteriales bacterium]|nr:hypothetical protein [Flavobacteriales bacterium]